MTRVQEPVALNPPKSRNNRPRSNLWHSIRLPQCSFCERLELAVIFVGIGRDNTAGSESRFSGEVDQYSIRAFYGGKSISLAYAAFKSTWACMAQSFQSFEKLKGDNLEIYCKVLS